MKVCDGNENDTIKDAIKEKNQEIFSYFYATLKRLVRREVYKDPLISSYLTNKKSSLANLLTRNINLSIESHADRVHRIHKFLFETLRDNPSVLLSQVLPRYDEIDNIVEIVLTKYIEASTLAKEIAAETETETDSVYILKKLRLSRNDIIESIAHETHQTITNHLKDYTDYKEKLITTLTFFDASCRVQTMSEAYSNFWKSIIREL